MDTVLKVAGKHMNVYIKGDTGTYIVLLSGSGVPIPKLEYQLFINELAIHHQVLLIEKFGYGFSDCTSERRTVEAVVEDYRAALKQLGISEPVIVAAHSMGFIEALFWAQLYPAEVAGFIGLDPATPDAYREFDVETALAGLIELSQNTKACEQYAASIFIDYCEVFRFTDAQQREYHALLKRNIANTVWISEAKNLRESISLVENGNTVQIPHLFFISDGQGTSLSCDVWRKHSITYLKNIEKAAYQLYEYPHDAFYKIAHAEMATIVHEFISNQGL